MKNTPSARRNPYEFHPGARQRPVESAIVIFTYVNAERGGHSLDVDSVLPRPGDILKTGRKVVQVASAPYGILVRANRNPNSKVLIQRDSRQGASLMFNKGERYAAYCTVFHKDNRMNIVAAVPLSEYNRFVSGEEASAPQDPTVQNAPDNAQVDSTFQLTVDLAGVPARQVKSDDFKDRFRPDVYKNATTVRRRPRLSDVTRV